MSRIEAVVSALVLTLAGCGGGGESAVGHGDFAGVPLLPLLGAGVDGGRAEPVVGYRWAGRGTVPWPFDEVPGQALFGPVGRTPSTLLYLTFEGPLTREAAEQTPSWTLAPSKAAQQAPAQGRFGGGLAVPAEEQLSLHCDAELSAPALTVEFWLRPERVEAGPVLSLPRLFELSCRKDGVLLLEARSGKEVVTSASALASGQWSHVGIVVDRELLRVVRLVLDGQARMGPLTEDDALGEPGPSVGQLDLGGGRLAFSVDDLRLSGRPANTSELIEAWEARHEPLERLELATKSGARTLEVWTSFLRDPVVDDAAEWAAGELSHALPGDDGLRWVEGDWRRLRALDPPLARTCHPTVYLGDGRLFVFSGEVRDSHLPPMRNTPDTWFFHTRGESWERVPTALAPLGRCHQQAAYSPDHDLVLMPGGWDNDGEDTMFADTWVFHVAERRWEQRTPSGPGLQAGGEKALVYHPRLRKFLAFQADRVMAYDPESDRWEAHRADSTDERGVPSDHGLPHSLSAAYDPASGGVVLFGGEGWKKDKESASTFFDRTLLYEPSAERMIVLDLEEHPSPRVRPGFAYDSRRARIVLFGGVRDQFSQRMDDLWSFDPARRRWTRHEASGTPPVRGGYMLMAYDPELDRFFLLCGRHTPERFLEEAWSLSLDEHAEGHARYAFDRAAFGTHDEWFSEGATPGDSALEFRFRASADGLTFGAWGPLAASAERYLEVEVTLRPGTGGERPVLHAMGFRRSVQPGPARGARRPG